LFGPDFPDFTGIADQMEPDSHPMAAPPRIEQASEESRSFGKAVVKRVRELRRANLWRIGIICHAESYWPGLVKELEASNLPLFLIMERGQKLPADGPVVALTRPSLAGGQEFDAVILVGLEQGVVPPRVVGNDALAAAVEQQTLREIYLAVTRARYRLMVLLSAGSTPNTIIEAAESKGLLVR
jgi:hypothetical protein